MSKLPSKRFPMFVFAGFQQFDELDCVLRICRSFHSSGACRSNGAWWLMRRWPVACHVGVSQTVGAAYDLVQDGMNGYKFDPANEVSIEEALTRLALILSSVSSMADSSREIIPKLDS